MSKRVTKKTIALLTIATIFIVIACAFGFIKITNRAFIIKEDNSFDFVQNVTEKMLLNYFEEPIVTIVDSDTQEKTVVAYSDLGIDRIIEKYSELENKMFIQLTDIENRIRFTDNNENIVGYIEELNKERPVFIYPTLVLNDGMFCVTDETVGKQLNADEIYVKIWNNLGKDTIINTKDFLIERDKDKPTVDELNKEVDKLKNSSITYTNDFKINAIDFKEFYLIEENTIVINRDKKSEFIKAIDKVIDVELAEYDTVGKGFEFTTTGGDTITVKGGTWGNIFSSDRESEYIVDKFSRFEKEENRKPIYIQEYAEEIGDRYVEISLKDQYLWFYDKGELVMESKVVTGTANTSRATPVGVYYISEMIPGKNLRGADYVTWVNRWMRITNQGHGLHDAYWRGSFGGNIYTYNGSHGCINLPKSFAYSLYEKLNVKDCVIIY